MKNIFFTEFNFLLQVFVLQQNNITTITKAQCHFIYADDLGYGM